MKKKKFAPKSAIKKMKLNKTVVSNFDVKKVKGGRRSMHTQEGNNASGG